MNDSRRSYKARHILLEDIEDAHYVLDKLNNGEDFATLAKDLSECQSSEKGGMLPIFKSGQMSGPFEKAVHKLKDNEISDPVESEHGFHIIQRLPL